MATFVFSCAACGEAPPVCVPEEHSDALLLFLCTRPCSDVQVSAFPSLDPTVGGASVETVLRVVAELKALPSAALDLVCKHFGYVKREATKPTLSVAALAGSFPERSGGWFASAFALAFETGGEKKATLVLSDQEDDDPSARLSVPASQVCACTCASADTLAD